MTEFKVGDKVETPGHGQGVLTYGPYRGRYNNTAFLVKIAGGQEVVYRAGRLTAIPVPPAFAIGDKVTVGGQPGKLAGGPYVSIVSSERFWVVEREDGKHNTSFEYRMTKVADEAIKVGDRVRVVEDDPGYRTGTYAGKTGVVAYLTGYETMPYHVRFDDGQGTGAVSSWNCAKVEKIDSADTYTHNGVTYELGAVYIDKDGDAWRFADVSGTVRGGGRYGTPDADSTSLDEVVRTWGPLRKD
ncbi:phiSA1p31-related protein [Streptomyces sp. NPDC006638]|uniref:phiSA1p31-related protein n=1 Tax=Streptomyces sp. NPDC006638 TaxID=3157183 RepID=UPI0033B5BFD9